MGVVDKDLPERYLRQIRNAVIVIAVVVCLGALGAAIAGIVIGVQSGAGGGQCVSQGGSVSGC